MTMKLIFSFLFLSTAFAQDGTQEAIILNQEMQFLEESAQNVGTTNLPGSQAAIREQRSALPSLERTYFGEDSEDAVSTQTAAPKRRGL